MTVPGCYTLPACPYLLGSVFISTRAVFAIAELTLIVISPGPQGAIFLNRQCVPGSCGSALPVTFHTNLCRGVSIDIGPVTKLPVLVKPPSPQGTIISNDYVMFTSGISTEGICDMAETTQ